MSGIVGSVAVTGLEVWFEDFFVLFSLYGNLKICQFWPGKFVEQSVSLGIDICMIFYFVGNT